jgi:hypothetical protein
MLSHSKLAGMEDNQGQKILHSTVARLHGSQVESVVEQQDEALEEPEVELGLELVADQQKDEAPEELAMALGLQQLQDEALGEPELGHAIELEVERWHPQAVQELVEPGVLEKLLQLDAVVPRRQAR